jgi:hypothetical protein
MMLPAPMNPTITSTGTCQTVTFRCRAVGHHKDDKHHEFSRFGECRRKRRGYPGCSTQPAKGARAWQRLGIRSPVCGSSVLKNKEFQLRSGRLLTFTHVAPNMLGDTELARFVNGAKVLS